MTAFIGVCAVISSSTVLTREPLLQAHYSMALDNKNIAFDKVFLCHFFFFFFFSLFFFFFFFLVFQLRKIFFNFSIELGNQWNCSAKVIPLSSYNIRFLGEIRIIFCILLSRSLDPVPPQKYCIVEYIENDHLGQAKNKCVFDCRVYRKMTFGSGQEKMCLWGIWDQ